jgi:hypothetical protein
LLPFEVLEPIVVWPGLLVTASKMNDCKQIKKIVVRKIKEMELLLW